MSIMLDQTYKVDMVVKAKNKYLKENVLHVDVETLPSIHIINLKPHIKLGKELEAVLKPLNVMDVLFLCTKYKLRKGKLIPHSSFYNVLSISFTFLLMLASCYIIFTSSLTVQMKSCPYCLQFIRIIFYSLLAIGAFLNCYINIFRSKNMFLFLLKIKHVYKTLKMFKDIKSLAFSNWCYVVILQVYHLHWIVYSCFCYTPLSVGNNVTGLFWIVLDAALLYAIRIMRLLTLPLEKWVKEIKLIRFDDEESWTKMLEVYKDLLEAYGIFEETFETLVL